MTATAVLAVYGVATGQPAEPLPVPGGVKAPTPAGSSAVESNDVPPLSPSPARFAVAPFYNHSEAKAWDWLVAGAPFEIAEKTEDVLDLEPTGGPLHVSGPLFEPEIEPVAAFGVERDAQWVVTGWIDRPNWQLRIAVTLWKVSGKGKAATAVVVAEAQRTGDPKAYHQLLGEAVGQMWSKGAGIQIDLARQAKLVRPLATDVYAVNLMSRGLGHLTGVFGKIDLKAAEHDLERAVFIDPKCPEAQRLLGELYQVLATADPKLGGDPKFAGRAAGKFAYANDLAPDNIGSLRAAAAGATKAGKHEVARDLLRKLVMRKPWDLDARFSYGSSLWQTGDGTAAERQLTQVIKVVPDHLPARRVMALIYASRGDTSKLLGELESIAQRAPADLEVKADLATAYGSVGKWDRASTTLEQIAAVRPNDLPLIVRIGDARRYHGDLDGALQWYARGARLAPDSSMPGFVIAQAQVDAGRYPDAIRTYTGLQKYASDVGAAEHALGAIALMQNRGTDAAWYLRRAVKNQPRVIQTWRAMIAAELTRRDHDTALKQLDRALATWPNDAQLLYLAGVAHTLADERNTARERFARAIALQPALVSARTALGQLDAGGQVSLVFTPEIVRPWGDAKAIVGALETYAAAAKQMANARSIYQTQFLKLLAAFGKGPLAPGKNPQVRTCPIDRVAPLWSVAQGELRRYERLGNELEASYRFIARHDEIGATAALLPNARAQVTAAKQAFRTALADVGELRSEWARGIVPELRFAGCSDKLLAAAVADPDRYRIIQTERAETKPPAAPPRPKLRATFYVDNTKCPDSVDVWIDGTLLGQVAPGRRSALVADGGERTLCLINPGAAQCGDRGTVRQVYLHDGWTATLHCPK
jgi:tetratricopeptide (TPR) repeat protein